MHTVLKLIHRVWEIARCGNNPRLTANSSAVARRKKKEPQPPERTSNRRLPPFECFFNSPTKALKSGQWDTQRRVEVPNRWPNSL